MGGLSKNGTKEAITERNSFSQNYSVVNLHEKYKELVGESQKIKTGTMSNNSQINLFNRYSKKDKEKEQHTQNAHAYVNNSKLKT